MKYTRIEAITKAQQYAYDMRRGRHTVPKEKVSFEEWMLNGIRKYEEQGADFELIESGLVKICWPGKVPMLRSLEDFHREYESKFPTATKVRFEEAAGIA